MGDGIFFWLDSREGSGGLVIELEVEVEMNEQLVRRYYAVFFLFLLSFSIRHPVEIVAISIV